MRDTTQLHPKLQFMLLALVMKCEERGLHIKITECLRTVEEQDALYAQGRTTAGNIVTNARGSAFQSMHQWGVAADFCRNDGRGAFDNADGFFDRVGKIGQEIGLEWGGSWTSPVDKPHFQLPDWGSAPDTLKRLYGNPLAFMATWQPLDLSEDKYTKYKTTKNAYLRKSAGGEIVMYDDLSAAVKGKCRKNMRGYAVFLRGNTFNCKKLTAKDGNMWAEMQSGLYFPVKKSGATRAKKI